jgi:hypothetical protein
MAGENILKAEMEAIQTQTEADAAYNVYIDDYGNYGNWMDCNDWH